LQAQSKRVRKEKFRCPDGGPGHVPGRWDGHQKAAVTLAVESPENQTKKKRSSDVLGAMGTSWGAEEREKLSTAKLSDMAQAALKGGRPPRRSKLRNSLARMDRIEGRQTRRPEASDRGRQSLCNLSPKKKRTPRPLIGVKAAIRKESLDDSFRRTAWFDKDRGKSNRRLTARQYRIRWPHCWSIPIRRYEWSEERDIDLSPQSVLDQSKPTLLARTQL